MRLLNVSKGTLIMDDKPKDGWGNPLNEIHIYLVRKGKNRKFFGRFSNESILTAMVTFERVAGEIGIVDNGNY
jgi:hypothetical protein